MRELISDALTRLPKRERTILTLYYEKELTLKEIGGVIGVCESRVSQLRALAVSRMRTHLTATLGV
jgi:RNA polymerase sigma factor for flagellar operon FliA